MSNIHRAYHAIRGLSTREGKPDQRGLRVRDDAQEDAPRAPAPSISPWPSTGPSGPSATTSTTGTRPTAPPMEQDLSVQIPEIRRACAAYRIPILEMAGYEADDVIGTLARRGEEAGFDVVIVTADKDMLQLVSGSRVRVFHTGREKFLDEKGVAEFFGVPPAQVVDVLALMGDSSDNIPGVPRVGEVTAKKWISEYGSLDRLLERADEIKGKVGESLREHREDAILSRRLAAIRTDLPIPFDPDALRRSAPDIEKLRDLFVELEFHSLAAEIQGEVAQAGALFAPAGRRRGLRVLRRRPVRGGHAAARAATRSSRSARAPASQIAEGPAAALAARWPALAGPAAHLRAGRRQAARPAPRPGGPRGRPGTSSTSGSRSTSSRPASAAPELEPLLFQRLGRKISSDKEAGLVNGSAARGSTGSRPPTAGWPSAPPAAAALAGPLRDELAARPALEKVYREIERPLTPVLARMELYGVAIDAPFLNEMSARMEKDLRALEQTIWQEAGEEFNVNSPVTARHDPLREARLPRPEEDGQDEVLLHGRRGPLGAGRARVPAAQARPRVPRDLQAQGHLRRRAAGHRRRGRGACTRRFARRSRRRDGCPRPTRTCRTSRSARPPGARSAAAFVAPPGRRLVVADYSQIELRILAHLSGDAALIQTLRAGAGHPPRDGGEGLRRLAGPRLGRDALRRQADQLRASLRDGRLLARPRTSGVSTSEAKTFIEAYFAQFPGVRGCLDGVLAEARGTERGHDASSGACGRSRRSRPPTRGVRVERRAHGLERARSRARPPTSSRSR